MAMTVKPGRQCRWKNPEVEYDKGRRRARGEANGYLPLQVPPTETVPSLHSVNTGAAAAGDLAPTGDDEDEGPLLPPR